MTYFWYRIFNESDLQGVEFNSKLYTLNLEGIGLRDILATKKNLLSITYEGVMLSVNLNSKNPFYFDGHAVARTSSGDIYLGVGE